MYKYIYRHILGRRMLIEG